MLPIVGEVAPGPATVAGLARLLLESTSKWLDGTRPRALVMGLLASLIGAIILLAIVNLFRRGSVR